MRTAWNSEEDAALDYLPYLDQVIYLRGIRRRMDYATGVAGIAHPISYLWLSQMTEVRPAPGSHVRLPARLKKDELRSIFARLERSGLVERIRDHGLKSLVFRCLLADWDQSVSERSHPGATHAAPAMSHPIPGTGIPEEERRDKVIS
jgi:hypothetical protein